MSTLRTALFCLLLTGCAVAPPECARLGQWVALDSGRAIRDPVGRVTPNSVVLLGEQHDQSVDHRWQLAVITQIAADQPGLVLGFEMFPRADQPVLDRWVAGGMSEPEFLRQADWEHVWGFDPALYLPIFRFARDHHLPMLALNISPSLVHRVAHQGWAAIPSSAREGVGDPAAPTTAYRARLSEAMSGHAGMATTPAQLDHFIDAQLLWDRAMAEAIARQRLRAPGRPIVALIGEGHLQFREGVPHQLAALGLPEAAVWLPVHGACRAAPTQRADRG